MTRVCNGAMIAMVFASSIAGFAQSGSTNVEQKPVAQSAPVSTTLKGVIKKIDDASIVLTPSSNKNGEVTFQLTTAAKRAGSLATGETVSVTYHFENGARVVTAVTGKDAAKN
jgi:Cu/Ag efflux protein CusF